MKVTAVVLGVSLLFVASFAEASVAPPFGRFVGVLKHRSLKMDQLAKLDFVASREENNELQLAAILTLHFGGYDNPEYVAYHYNDVRFNLLTQTFVFNESGQQATLVAKQYTGDRFAGEFRPSHTGELLELELRREGPARPTQPLIQPLNGEYQGQCISQTSKVKTDTRIQIVTSRSEGGAEGIGDPFRAYKIRGLLGEKDGSCGSRPGSYCTWASFTSGSYNFYTQKLSLHSRYRNLLCRVDSTGITCDNCGPLTRVSEETKSPPALSPVTSKSVFAQEALEPPPAIEGEVTTIKGNYSGWLHHEYLNTYQAASMSILTFQIAPQDSEDTPQLRMSAVASLHFGDHGAFETLNYSFAERSFPNPLVAPQFLFQEKERDVDAILQVTKIGNGAIEGVWFSHLFGRVGTFVLRKNGPPKLPKEVKRFEPVTGEYESAQWEVGVVVGQGVGEPNNQNPFSPLGIEGWVRMYDVTPRKDITSGTYDFYTGKIGFDLEDDDARVGMRPHRQRLHLKKTVIKSTAPFPAFKPEVYRLREDQ